MSTAFRSSTTPNLPRHCVTVASLAAGAGVTIEHIAKPHVRKEDVVARALTQLARKLGFCNGPSCVNPFSSVCPAAGVLLLSGVGAKGRHLMASDEDRSTNLAQLRGFGRLERPKALI